MNITRHVSETMSIIEGKKCEVKVDSYPLRVGTVTSVSWIQLLRSINPEDLEEDPVSGIKSVSPHCK